MGEREELREKVWEKANSSMSGMEGMIDQLISYMPLETLREFVRMLERGEEE